MGFLLQNAWMAKHPRVIYCQPVFVIKLLKLKLGNLEVGNMSRVFMWWACSVTHVELDFWRFKIQRKIAVKSIA